MKPLYYLFTSMRPRQWTKNLVVFAGLIFSRNIGDEGLVLRSVVCFVIFCLLSGAIYIVNDIADVERDRRHPLKQHRPLASGRLPVPLAALGAGVAAILGLAMATRLGGAFAVVVCSFCALNLFYSFLLKRLAMLDVVSISLSFVLRAIGGVEALREADPNIAISPWLLICTLFLSLLLGFCKRRHELLTLEDAVNHRASLQDYSPALLDQLVSITAGGSVLSYAIYTIWPDTVEKFSTTNLVYTVPLVLLGVMRYLYLVYSEQKGGDPSELLLRDRFLLLDVAAWIAVVIAILGDF